MVFGGPAPSVPAGAFYWAMGMSIKYIKQPLHTLAIIMSFLESRAMYTVTFRWRVTNHNTVVNDHFLFLTTVFVIFKIKHNLLSEPVYVKKVPIF